MHASSRDPGGSTESPRPYRNLGSRQLLAYLAGRKSCPGLPATLVVAPTHRCNLSCRMCLRSVRTFAKPDLSPDLLWKILDQGQGLIRHVILDGPGEPLLHPDLFELIRGIRERRPGVSLSTNATLLDSEATVQFLESGLDSIIFPIDGATSEVYEHYRRGARYDEVAGNVRAFLRRKRERGNRIFVTLQMIRLPLNRHQVSTFLQQWRLPGVDAVRIKEDVVCLENVCLPERTLRPPIRNRCPHPWLGPFFIDVDGSVYPCPYSLWKIDPVGNLNTQSLAEIWNGRHLRALRLAHRLRCLEGFPACCDCTSPKPRFPLIMGAFLARPDQILRLVPKFEKWFLLKRLPLFESVATGRIHPGWTNELRAAEPQPKQVHE